MRTVPFDPKHAIGIKLQPMQEEMIGLISPEYAAHLAAIGPAFSGIEGDEVMICGGIAQMWEGRHILWAILSIGAGPKMLKIVRTVRRLIELQSGCGRLEAVVRSDFGQAHRLVKLCGLAFHHHEEKFLPGGLDADIYVRFC